MNLLLIPGFFGLPSDFDLLISQLQKNNVLDSRHSEYLNKFSEFKYLAPCCLEQSDFFAEMKNTESWLEEIAGQLRLWHQSSGQKILAVGYSMGGRILVALTDYCPEVFSGVVFLSSNPGFIVSSERKTRWQHDLKWSDKILSDDWSVLQNDWNNQPVLQSFKNKNLTVLPEEQSFDRKQLARTMRFFSLAKQKPFALRKNILNLPQLWISGEKDSKYSNFINELSENNILKNKKGMTFKIIPFAGHRLLSEAPEEVAQEIISWFWC